ncbi:MAG: carbon storage regulator [Candidatus Scalindua sp.]|nr:carbon storage regulator [Candidatus Scalindua sp.]
MTIDKLKSKIIGDGVKITVKKINSGQVKLGIRAPESMSINRNEVPKEA